MNGVYTIIVSKYFVINQCNMFLVSIFLSHSWLLSFLFLLRICPGDWAILHLSTGNFAPDEGERNFNHSKQTAKGLVRRKNVKSLN